MERRIESKISRTAEFTCLARGLSYLEKQPQLHSEDEISLRILNSVVRSLIRFPLGRSWFKRFYPTGMYEYIIARTKYIDEVFDEATQNSTEQALIFGAGFDSRGIRFQNITKHMRIFELDAPITQSAKRKQYDTKRIDIPDNLTFIPIDFDRQSISERLLASGFQKRKKSLFVLEGLTMYLSPEAVQTLFTVLHDFAGPGSKVVFDFVYASVLRRENLFEGERELYDSVTKNNERFLFGIEVDQLDDFLSIYGFKPLQVMNTNALRDKYFRDERGTYMAAVNGTHCLVSAIIV